MPILSTSDQADYFPDLAISQGQIASALARIQGPMGANRPLEISTFVEAPYISGDTVFLAHWPIALKADGTPDVTIEIRQGYQGDLFGRSAYSGNDNSIRYQVLDSSCYDIDAGQAEIRLHPSVSASLSFSRAGLGTQWGGSSIFGHYTYPTEEPLDTTQVRVTYKAGFDFDTNPLSAGAAAIKAAAADYLRAQAALGGVGIIKKRIEDFVSIELSPNTIQGVAQREKQDALATLKTYCARSFA